MFKTILGAIGASTALLCGHAAAAPITLNAGDSAIFNFAGPAAVPFKAYVEGYAGDQSATGTIAYYGGANLTEGLIYTDNDLATMGATDHLTDAAILDGFSILISITSGSFTIDPDAAYVDRLGDPVAGGEHVAAAVGVDNRTSSVPEPGSLLLVALAGLALGATRRHSAAA